MLASYLTGVLAVALIAVGWLAVQTAWKRAFPDRHADPDALAGRMGCHGDCADDCRDQDCPLTGGEERR